MNVLERFKVWKERCRTCELDGIDGSLIERFPDLQPVEPLKFGALYQCLDCGRSWFHSHDGKWLHRIPENALPLVHHWNGTRLTLDPSILAVLADIGGVVNYYRTCIATPCSVTNAHGVTMEKAMVWVSRQPPLRWPETDRVHWADEVARVTPSPYALPMEIRWASTKRREVAMAFAPVGVSDRQGREYTLGCESHFFDHDGIHGEGLALTGRKKRWRRVIWPEPAQAYYFVDWFDGCEELLASIEPAPYVDE